MIGRLLAGLARLWTKPCIEPEATFVLVPRLPVATSTREVIDPVRIADGFRILWKVRDAIVMWLSHPDRINGRWTCAEITAGINADDVYRFENSSPGKLKDRQVNAALSGISIRVRCSPFCTDIDMSDGQSVHAKPEDGLKTPWRLRRWQLTPDGIGRAKTISRAHNHYTDAAEQRRGRGDAK